jgi:hypothetical protein
MADWQPRPFTSSITLGELEELVKDYIRVHGDESREKLIAFASNYGDRGRTQQIHDLEGEIEEMAIDASGHSESGYALVSQGRFEREESGVMPKREYQTVLVIS